MPGSTSGNFLNWFFPGDRQTNFQDYNDFTTPIGPRYQDGHLPHFAMNGIQRDPTSNLTRINSFELPSGIGVFRQSTTLAAGLSIWNTDLRIVNGATLTILPGTELAFGPPERGLGFPPLGLYVSGDSSRLSSFGTATQPIIFRSASLARGGWKGVTATGTSRILIGSSVVRDAELAVQSDIPHTSFDALQVVNCQTGLLITQGRPTIRGSLFSQNQQAIFVTTPDTTQILESTFSDNTFSISVAGSAPIIRGNIFRNGTTEIHMSTGSSPFLSHNLLIGNGSGNSYGIRMDAKESVRPPIANNTVTLYQYGCLVDPPSPPGSASAQPIVRNNILYRNNESTLPGGGTIYGDGSLKFNNIFNLDGYDPPNIPPHEGNIRFDPLFADPPNGNYSLMYFSPSIDAGDPTLAFAQEPQPNGNRINQGHHGNTPQATRSFTIVASGSISGNVTWSGNVLIENDVRVEESGSLTIAPGTKVWVAPQRVFEVFGSLTAVGAPLDSIVFVSDDPSQLWYGIVLGKSSFDTRVQYCSISGAGTGITIEPSQQYITNCTIDGCGTGIDVYTIDGHVEPLIESNEIRNCSFGIYFHQAPLSDVRDNHIHSNDIGVYMFASNPLFHNNIIENNRGFGVLTEESSPRFGDYLPNDRGCNTIRNNTTGAESADLLAVGGEPFLGFNENGEEFGGYNQVYSDHAGPPCIMRTENGAYIRAYYTWWGEDRDPPRPELFCENDGKIDYSKPLSSEPQNCNSAFAQFSMSVDPEERLLNAAAAQRGRRNFAASLNAYSTFVSNRPNSRYASRALRELRQTYRDFRRVSRDSTMQRQLLNVLTNVANTHSSLDVKRTALGLLAEEHLSTRDWNRARTAWEQLRTNAGNTRFERNALHSLFAMSAYSLRDTSASLNILTVLRSRFPNDRLTRLAEMRYAALTRRRIPRLERAGAPDQTLVVETPNEFKLHQNFPNPFNPSTTIKFQLPSDGLITLKVYDILGREVATLVNDQRAAGFYEIPFDASQFASGVYIYRMQSSDFVAVKRMMLLK
jgi:hypothetical protein